MPGKIVKETKFLYGIFILFFLSLFSFSILHQVASYLPVLLYKAHFQWNVRREVEALFSLPLGQSPNFDPAIQRRVGGGSQGRRRHWWVVTSFLLILAICLFFCLILFLAQVHWHTRDAMESDLLWAYYLNWWSDFLYMFAGESDPCLIPEGLKGNTLLEREVESRKNRSTDCSYLEHLYIKRQYDMKLKI